MNITPETRIADIAAQNPATIKIFQQFGIDFCCGGKRPLAEACKERQITVGELTSALVSATSATSAGQPAATGIPGADAKLADLIRFIVDRYHADLRVELPRLAQMAAKVLDAHGAKHPGTFPELVKVFAGLRAELDSHMMKEERILFPYVERLEALAAADETLPASPFGSIQAPIGMMEHEHDDAARALARLRVITNGYTPPADACNTFRGLYHGLAELEKALHEHIHLENNVVFPRATRLEEELVHRVVI